MSEPRSEHAPPVERACRCCGDPCDVPNLTHCRACWEGECIPPLGCSKVLSDG